jgi:hypothetical protein
LKQKVITPDISSTNAAFSINNQLWKYKNHKAIQKNTKIQKQNKKSPPLGKKKRVIKKNISENSLRKKFCQIVYITR